MALALGVFAAACGDDDPVVVPDSDTGADTPTEDTPMEDTPMEDTPTEDTPMGDTPMEDTPMEDTPMGDTPTEDTPMEDTPMGDTPMGDTGEGGACTNEADLALINSDDVDVTGAAQTCGLGCLGDDDPGACSAACVSEETGISEACAGCYGDTVLCSAENCLADCAMDPAGDACGECQAEFCLDDFYACTGLPPVPGDE